MHKTATHKVGRSLSMYGEWSEHEVVLFSQLVSPGDTIYDVGANLGAFTIPLSKMVGEHGRVVAFGGPTHTH